MDTLVALSPTNFPGPRLAGYYMAISGSRTDSAFFSGISVMVASVSSSTLATDTAFSRPMLHDLDRIDNARLDQVDIFLARRLEAVVALAVQHAGDDHTALDRRILGDLAGRNSSARLRICASVLSSPSHFVSSAATFSKQRSRNRTRRFERGRFVGTKQILYHECDPPGSTNTNGIRH